MVTRSTDYAIRALMEMAAERDAFLSARMIAERQHIPYQFLRRILRELLRSKLALSAGGRAGGFRLGKDPASITAFEVMELFQGDIQLSDCMFRGKACRNRGDCVLRKRILKIDGVVKKELEGITIAGLLKDQKKHKGGQ